MTETLLYVLSVILKLGIIPVALLIYKKKISFVNGLFAGTLLFLASFGCTVHSANMMYGGSIIDSTVNGVFDSFAKAAEQSGLYAAEEADAFKAVLNLMKETYFVLIPSVLVCTNLVFAYCLLMLSKGFLALCKKDVSMFLRFCDFKMSRFGIVLGIAAYIISEFSQLGTAAYAFLNFAVIILFAVTVCGLSVVDFKFRKVIKPSVPRFLIYCPAFVLIFATMGFGTGVLLFIGVWDAFFDLRSGRAPRNEQ